jgi:hypothetical protein
VTFESHSVREAGFDTRLQQESSHNEQVDLVPYRGGRKEELVLETRDRIGKF